MKKHDDPTTRALSDDELYTQARRAIERGDRDRATRLYVAMAERGAPYERQRDVVNALWPPVPWSRRGLRGGRR